MSTTFDFPLALGPFHADLDIRNVGADSVSYAFPVVRAQTMTLKQAIKLAPSIREAEAKLRGHLCAAQPAPLVAVTRVSSDGLLALFPGMQLAPTALVYRVPADWAEAAADIACKDSTEVFGLAELGRPSPIARAGKLISTPEPTKLFMGLQQYTDMLSACPEPDPGFIGSFVAHVVLCGDTVVLGGFFFDSCVLAEQMASLQALRCTAGECTPRNIQKEMAQANIVGVEPWRHRPWPALDSVGVRYLVETEFVE